MEHPTHSWTTPVRWAWTHKRRVACVISGFVIVVYACIYAVVASGVSPADQFARLPNGDTLAYTTSTGSDGSGAVVLVHGCPADASCWTKLIQGHRASLPSNVVAVDRLGYGNSSSGVHGSLAEQAAALVPFLEPTDGRKPILVGHSYGGPVVLRAAVDHSDRIGGIVLVAGACDAYMQDAQWLRRAVEWISPIVPEPWEVANAELLALTDENRVMEPLLDRVTCPVVIVHGTWDPVCPHDATVAYLQERLVNAQEVRVVSLPRAGHNLHLGYAEVLAEQIRTLTALEH